MHLGSRRGPDGGADVRACGLPFPPEAGVRGKKKKKKAEGPGGGEGGPDLNPAGRPSRRPD